MKERNENELRTFAHVSLVTAIVVFSILIFVLNLISGWERWVLVLLIFAPVISCVMHIKQYPMAKSRMRIYVIILLMETFYYCDKIYMVFDAAPVVVMIMILFAMSQEYLFVWLALVAGYAGMALHIYERYAEGTLETNNINVMRTVLHFLVIFIAGVLIYSIEKTVRVMKDSYENQIKKLRDQNNSASDFLANVSHEIRTPINAVVGLTGVCIEKEKDKEIRNDLESIVSAGQRISDQISDILDYSEIDIEKLAVNNENYMLESILKDIVKKIEPYKPDNIELVIDVDPKLPVVLNSDAAKIKKILMHLILNGLKYTNEGGVYVNITSEKQEYGLNLNIEVSDTGIGMNEEELARVFERFYQANSGITRRAGGLGLGLPIAVGFVRALGGFITMQSKAQKGTCVRVSLPQKIVDKSECMTIENRDDLSIGSFLHFERYEHPQVREYYNEMIKNLVKGLKVQLHRMDSPESLKMISGRVSLSHLFLGQEEYELTHDFVEELGKKTLVMVVADKDFELPDNSNVRIMRKPFYSFPVVRALNTRHYEIKADHEQIVCPGIHALVVDDEPLNLTVAKGIFNKYQMIVTTAASGQEAIDLCREKSFDIIFMDHMMPGMDGIETVKRIRTMSRERVHEIPIVALTANATSAAREMFAAEGFNGFVSKPIEIIELDRVLKNVLPAAVTVIENKDNKTIEVNESKGLDTKGKEKSKSLNTITSDFEEILTNAGVDVDLGLYHTQNDADFYCTLIRQFYEDAEKKKIKIEDYFRDSDYKNYQIAVHALKSTAKMIGAENLSKQALELEMAAKKKDSIFMSKKHGLLIQSFSDTVESIGLALNELKQNKTEIVENEDDEIFVFEPQGGENA